MLKIFGRANMKKKKEVHGEVHFLLQIFMLSKFKENLQDKFNSCINTISIRKFLLSLPGKKMEAITYCLQCIFYNI